MTVTTIIALLALTTVALSMLPSSPFNMVLDMIGQLPYLEYVNWIIPVTEMIALGQSWLLAITTVYIVSALLRWIKAIE